MKRSIVFLLVCALALGALGFVSLGEEEEDVSFKDLTGGDNPAIAAPEPTATPEPNYQADGSVIVTISAVGDITIGKNANYSGQSIFEKELKRQDGDTSFMFKNTRDILLSDDLTIANFEGVLTDNPVVPSAKQGNDYLFYASPDYASVLKDAGIEAVAFENNHCMDFGQSGYDDTAAALDSAGIVYSNASTVGSFETQGVRIGMLSYQTFNGLYPTLYEQVPRDIAAIRGQYDIIIVSFHWGEEKDYAPNANQQKLAKITVDAGADLVLGHHSHRINPMEIYGGKYIAYSLANFSFAGNNKPSDMTTYILQVRFKVKDGEVSDAGMRIIPCRISSRTDYNDFIPTPYDNKTYIENNILSVLYKQGKNLANPVTNYPLEWE